MASFEIRLRLEQRFLAIENVHLSISQSLPVAKKDLIGMAHAKAARKTPLEHLEDMAHRGCLRDVDRPLMVVSVRNVLSNLRCIAYLAGYTRRPIGVAEEFTFLRFDQDALDALHTAGMPAALVDAVAAAGPLERPIRAFLDAPDYARLRPYEPLILAQAGTLERNRNYAILGQTHEGKLTIEEYAPGTGTARFQWFVSGVPVLWDDEDDKALFRRMVTQAADHSHVWRLPRGNHPEATTATRTQWKTLQDRFLGTLTDSQEKAFSALNEYATDEGLIREDTYLHHILGLDSQGRLCQLIARGRLEDLGRDLQNLYGVQRALLVDNSGSITVQFHHKGLAGARTGTYRPLIAAPNHRLPGTAYLVIELADATFR